MIMAGSGMDEKRSIRESARSLKKYGSTSNHLKRQEHFVKHSISETDTLQGIALKYGVTVILFTCSRFLATVLGKGSGDDFV